MTALPCPNCGADLTFLEQYQRHFCYQCQQYAPEGYGARGPKICPNCGGILAYVAAYDRFFCYRCQAYAPAEAIAPGPTKAEGAEPAAQPAPAAAPAEPPGREAAEEEPAEGEYVVVDRPPLTRHLIETAKKSVLLDLCQAYDLDASGTKEQLKERLLSYLEEQEVAERPAEEEPEEEPAREGEAAAVVEKRAEPKEEVAPSGEAAQAVLLEEPRRRVPEMAVAAEARAEPVIGPGPTEGIREVPVFVPAAEPAAPAFVEYPCPRCGRELDYIAQYDRWYCHFCKAYAPKRTFKHACPTCGATLRWIERYGRWWCDTEQKYAPADLPAPEVAAAEAMVAPVVQAAPVVQETARPTIVVHRHRSPGGGIGLAAFGLFLWFVYQLLVEIPRVGSFPAIVTVSAEGAFLLQFFGFLFLGIGILIGLSSLRDRR